MAELVAWSHANGLPAIAALVVRRDRGIPGDGYYGPAHGMQPWPRLPAALAWAREVVAACAATYP